LTIWNRKCILWLQNLIFQPRAQRPNSLRRTSAFAFLWCDHPPSKLKFQILICSCSQTLSWLNRWNDSTFNRFGGKKVLAQTFLNEIQFKATKIKHWKKIHDFRFYLCLLCRLSKGCVQYWWTCTYVHT
jgi:hypothetical protein